LLLLISINLQVYGKAANISIVLYFLIEIKSSKISLNIPLIIIHLPAILFSALIISA
jgi:hypothetical protein